MSELLFDGKKVYFSGSIKGAPEPDPHFAWKLVQYIGERGADVLSEHVVARSQAEMDQIRALRSGLEMQEMLADPEPWFRVSDQDNIWVDEATHMVALVNAPSHGVGMEIGRAILKPERGLNRTPVLALIHRNLLDSLSYMIRGISPEKAAFQLRTYQDLAEAQAHTHDFLLETQLHS